VPDRLRALLNEQPSLSNLPATRQSRSGNSAFACTGDSGLDVRLDLDKLPQVLAIAAMARGFSRARSILGYTANDSFNFGWYGIVVSKSGIAQICLDICWQSVLDLVIHAG